MNKENIRKWMLLKRKRETDVSLYRVLETAEKILVIDCVKKTMPVWKKYEEFTDYVEEMEEKQDTLSTLDDMETGDRKIAYQRYNIISAILPFVGNETMRTEAIHKVAEEYGISKQTVRSYLCEYLSTMDIGSLAPRKREKDKPLTKDEKNMRKSLNRWYYTTKKRTIKNVYTMMLQNFYCDEDGKLKDTYPSYYQFRYFYRKYNKKETEYISRNGLSYYQRNQRPLVGDSVQSFAPTVGMGMLDSTVCDIYLVNEAGGIVGRRECKIKCVSYR